MGYDIASLKPTFITGDDYKMFWGKDLKEILPNGTNEAYKVDLFLFRRELEIKDVIDEKTFRRFDWDKLNDLQLKYMKLALLYQAEYVIRNGELSTDSGYDTVSGVKTPAGKVEDMVICPEARKMLQNGGLWNMQIKNHIRYGGYGNGGGGLY